MNSFQGRSFDHSNESINPDINQTPLYTHDFSRHINEKLTQKLISIINKYPQARINLVFADINNNQILVDINSQDRLIAASLIKILILIESLHQKMEYKDFDKPVVLKPSFKALGAGLLKYSPDDYSSYENINKNFLNYLMIVNSDNYATNLLIDQLTLKKINQRAEKLGLKQTKLNNMLMLLNNNNEAPLGNTTSLFDMAKAMKYIYLISKENTVFNDAIVILSHQCDRSAIPSAFSGLYYEKLNIYNKTATLNNARYDIAIIDTDTNTYVLGISIINIKQNPNPVIVELSREIFQQY